MIEIRRKLLVYKVLCVDIENNVFDILKANIKTNRKTLILIIQ